MENTFNKYQWSIFVKNGRDQQFVVRSNDKAEFAQLIKDVKELIGEEIVNPAPVVTEPVRENIAGMYCMTCKAPAKQRSGISKSGSPYNAIFCSTENKSHTQWL